jgi:hypothetical protein
MRNLIHGLILVCALSTASGVQAVGEHIDWQVVSPAGSSDASSAQLKLSSTMGQPGTGPSASSQLHSLAGFWQDFSIGSGGNVSCCVGRVGNANGLGNPPNEVTISDVQLLVFSKFISTVPCTQNLPCLTEADVNQSGGVSPKCSDVTISDIQTLVYHLFVRGPANAPLKSCL